MMERKVYGIDLGTTNSAIAVFEQGEAQIIKNIDGRVCVISKKRNFVTEDYQ